MKRLALALAVLMACWFSSAQAAEPPGPGDLAGAVAVMRNVPAKGLTQEQKQAKSQDLDRAWKTLVAAGPKGSAALKDELANLDASGGKDDFFRLGAAAPLWQIGNVDQAATIAAIWSGDVDLRVNYNYVFHTAFEAAQTRDARVLPMLVAVLKDQKGEVFIPMHSLTIDWPLSHAFIWGAFGSSGRPALERAMNESKDEVTRASAIFLLGQMQDVGALEKIRALAHEGSGPAHVEAVKALGVFGHPQDFDFLAAGLAGKDPMEVWACAYALYEYGDLRAVPRLVPLLSTENQRLGDEVVSTLEELLTPEGVEALQRCAASTADPQRRQACTYVVGLVMKSLNLTEAAYAAKTPPERAKLIESLRGRAEVEYRPRPGDRTFTHDDLLKAAAEWKANHRISGGAYAWVESRHVMTAATAEDIPLFLDVAAACYTRLSDECLDEVSILNGVIERLGRARYRREVGLCEKVVPLQP